MPNNKYRGVDISPVVAPSREPIIVSGTFEGGMVLSKSAQHLELNQSPKHDKVRVELGGLRPDYGPVQIGTTTAATAVKIYALGEHRFVLAGTTLYEKIFRLYHNGGVTATITYNGGAALTSLEVTAANEITSVGTTSFVGAVAVGDIIYLTNMSTAANNNVNCRVTVVAANKLTLAGTPLTIQAADSACSLHKLPSVARIDSYDSGTSEWVAEITDGGTDAIPIVDRLLSWKSFFNAVFFADGDKVFKWDQSTLVDDEGNDFPTTNLLEAVNDETTVTINPAGGALNAYKFYYSLVVTGPSEDGGEVTVGLWHAGVEIATKQRVIAQSSNTARVVTYAQELIEVARAIALDDVVTLKVKSITRPTVTRTQTLSRVGTTVVYEATPKSPVKEAGPPRAYTFKFKIVGSDTGLTLKFYFDYSGVGYILKHTAATYAGGIVYTEDLIADGDVADVVGFKVEFVEDPSSHLFDYIYAEWEERFEVEVHGFNKTTDLDAKAGVEYSVTGTQANDLMLVRPNVSELVEFIQGRYLGIIADRLVVLQADGDPQAIQYPVRGDMTDWEGDGSGPLTVLYSRSASIDALMALEMLSANVGALFRQRSIMRVVPTGSTNPALGFYPWIEKLGTESPFSVVATPYGVMFLGNDKQIYLLTEQGPPQAIGPAINEAFNISDLSIVEGVYHPDTQEYILSIPADH